MAKPDPGHLTQVIALAGGELARAIMVGDGDGDLRTARGADVPVVLVSFGYAPQPPHEFAPDAVIDHFDELAPLAARLLQGQLSRATRF